MRSTTIDENLFEEPLPEDPCALAKDWFDVAEEHAARRNWNSFMLATVAADGQPTVRTVLMKDYDVTNGAITFYTNYNSAKAKDIEHNPRVGIVFHWDSVERQIRMEGTVERASAEVSDAYFATRGRESQIGAWASDQSEELENWEALVGNVMHYAMKFPANEPVPRPSHWGGYVLVPHRIEFWHGRTGRVHERVSYTRTSDAAADQPTWRVAWVAP